MHFIFKRYFDSVAFNSSPQVFQMLTSHCIDLIGIPVVLLVIDKKTRKSSFIFHRKYYHGSVCGAINLRVNYVTYLKFTANYIYDYLRKNHNLFHSNIIVPLFIYRHVKQTKAIV